MKLKMITQSPTDRNRVAWLDSAVAWAAARGVAVGTHHAVILFGRRGTARFDRNGGGHVEWKDDSDITRFEPNTRVCI